MRIAGARWMEAGPLMGQEDFERLLRVPPALGRYAALEEINVIPVDHAYWVRAQRRYPAADGGGFEYRTEWLALRERQYRPIDPAARAKGEAGRAEYTVRDFLADAAARDPHIHYRYAWERDARFALPAWALGGALLIGGVWPWALGVMLGAGLGREGPAYDLSRFAPEAPGAEAGAELSRAERDRLAALEAELEGRLRNADGTGAGQPSEKRASDLPSAPRLGGEPLEAQAPQGAAAKQFDGEFYPTETHARQEPS